MKKYLLLALLFAGISASAQRSYYFGDYYLSEILIEQELVETPQAFNLFQEGKSDMNAGQWIMYPGAAVLGWGIGWELGRDPYYVTESGVPYIIGGALFTGLGYAIFSKGLKKKKQAIALHHQKKKMSFNMEALMNKNGIGLAIKLD